MTQNKPTKAEEKIEEFEERWWQIENPDTINEHVNWERRKIKEFLLSSLRQQRKEVLEEVIERIESLRPSKPYPNASNGYNDELDEEEKACDKVLSEALKILKELK